MAESVAILLDADRVRVLSPSARGAVVADTAWNPSAPESAVAALAARVPASARAVLVVGLGLLEIAQPELPPLDANTRRTLLLRDADRYFPVSDSVAVSWADGFAFAASSGALSAWMRAFGSHFTIRGVTTVVECLARANANGTWALAAGDGESGHAVVRDGTLVEVRRLLRSESSPATQPADLGAIARGAVEVESEPIESMLLDDTAYTRFRAQRRARWLASGVALVAALGAVAWAADYRRGRELDAAAARVATLSVAAEPAMRAAERLNRARAEIDAVATPHIEPGGVLARLGALLPRDAFIQRLEWDGAVWRIDGSALDAPRIVPLLDASPAFDDVRIVAASTRFLDAGQQRESFSISFRARAPESAVAAVK